MGKNLLNSPFWGDFENSSHPFYKRGGGGGGGGGGPPMNTLSVIKG